jgi:cell division protein FtsQ
LRKFSKIKKFILLFNIKILILLILTSLTLLITYFYYFKYKDLIFEQLTISKNKILYGSKENTKPKLIILGNRYINSKSLIHELDANLNSAENKNDLSLISNVLKKKKLIKKFIITKTSENLLTIKIEEKNIIGLTKIKNSNYLIDEFNNLIEEKITPKLFHLPFFNGKNSYKNANVILSLIRKSDVSINYISFSFIDNRRWNINLNNGVKILLPETNIIDTLKLLKKIDSEHNILKGNFIEIDLRIYKKFFLKPKIN